MALPPNILKVVVAITALFFIYLGSWQYNNPSTSIHPARPKFKEGEIHKIPHFVDIGSKILVVARKSTDDVSYIGAMLPGWQRIIYSVDGPSPGARTLPSPKGGVAMAYLTYIIDHFAALPETLVFIQGKNMAAMLSTLQLPFVQATGFANLRCMHEQGCPAESGINMTEFTAVTGSSGTRSASKVAAVLNEYWTDIFWAQKEVDGKVVWDKDGSDKKPEMLASSSGNQFAVSKGRVLTRSLKQYVAMRNWLIRTELDEETYMVVFEHLWQVIFLNQSIMCPEEMKCFCDLYGQC